MVTLPGYSTTITFDCQFEVKVPDVTLTTLLSLYGSSSEDSGGLHPASADRVWRACDGAEEEAFRMPDMRERRAIHLEDPCGKADGGFVNLCLDHAWADAGLVLVLRHKDLDWPGASWTGPLPADRAGGSTEAGTSGRLDDLSRGGEVHGNLRSDDQQDDLVAVGTKNGDEFEFSLDLDGGPRGGELASSHPKIHPEPGKGRSKAR